MNQVKLTTKQHNKIKRAVRSLNDVRQELEMDNPDNLISWYLEDSDNLNLMMNPSHHDGYDPRPAYEHVIKLYNLEEASGGGW